MFVTQHSRKESQAQLALALPINTGLQPGVCGTEKQLSCFNSFSGSVWGKPLKTARWLRSQDHLA